MKKEKNSSPLNATNSIVFGLYLQSEPIGAMTEGADNKTVPEAPEKEIKPKGSISTA